MVIFINFNYQKYTQMKKTLLVLLSILLVKQFNAQSIPNGGFESWSATNYENPNGFQTSNLEMKNGYQLGVNAVKTTDAQAGNYAIKLTTIAGTPNPNFAFFANGNPGGSGASGGIPYSQKPTGIRLYYKSNIIGTDTALFIVMFKKAGSYIGQYLYKITASQSNYTLFNPTFTPSLTVTPDTFIVAAASSNAFLNSGFQIGNSLQIDNMSFTGVVTQPASFNGSFENWTSFQSNRLNGWFTSTSGSFQRTTDAYSGNYALELQSVGPSFMNGQTTPGRAQTGTPTPSNTIGGHPYTTQVDTLVFYYKYLPATPMDSARISVTFKKNNVPVSGYANLIGISASYKKVSIPHNIGVPIDSVMITIESSKWPMQAGYIGSDLKIDNLFFASQRIPISNCMIPTTGCVGEPVQLTDISANMPNAWGWIMPGGTPGSSTLQHPTVIYNTPGTKTITMISSNQYGSGMPISKTITINPVPNVSVTSTITACGGSNIVLTASGAATYTWNFGATTATIAASPSVTTIYTVTGATNGCTNTAVAVAWVPQTPKPDICMVTVDSLNQYNEIYWDKTQYPNLDSMIVYREVISNTYKRIGAVSKNALSMLVDTARSVGPSNGDPNISTYRYKIQVRDTCGNYGPRSNWHNTVYFTHTGSTFIWTNNYMIEGPTNPVQTYSLLVCVNPSVSPTYSLVGTTTGNQSTLNDPFYHLYSATADWRVEADLGYVCTATQKIMASKSATKSRSNIQNNRMIGVKENDLTDVKIYPNPTKDIVLIQLVPSADVIQIEIHDVLGRLVQSETMEAGLGVKAINISPLSNGVYTIRLSGSNAAKVVKLIKE